MVVALLALVLLVVAAGSGTVLLEPQLVTWGVPSALYPATPVVLLLALLLPALVLSGDWLWMNGRRRQGPPRGVIVGRVALLTALVALVVPLVVTARPLEGVARGVVALGARYTKPDDSVAPQPAPVVPIARGPSVGPLPGPQGRRWGPTPTLPPGSAEPAPIPVVPSTGEQPPLPVLPEPPAPFVPPTPPPDGTFFVYEWLDATGGAHYSDDFSAIPSDGKVLRAIAMKPSPAGPAPAPVQPIARPGPSYGGYDPTHGGLVPSYAESYWRGRFKPVYRRISEQEAGIATKQHEIDNMPAMVNREAAFAQLRQMKEALKGTQRELEELETDASNRAVPREWRN